MAEYQLYLIRHGVAEDRGEAWPDDAKRPLTSNGASRLRKSARGLARLGVSIDVVLTSPLVRTRQTSDIVASVFDPRPPVVVVDALAPGGALSSLVSEIEKQSRRPSMALVGHEPDMGEIAAQLTGSASSPGVQEGRGLPHRPRVVVTAGQGKTPVVPHASDHARAATVGQEVSGGSGW